MDIAIAGQKRGADYGPERWTAVHFFPLKSGAWRCGIVLRGSQNRQFADENSTLGTWSIQSWGWVSEGGKACKPWLLEEVFSTSNDACHQISSRAKQPLSD
jgi:hypothetical protein